MLYCLQETVNYLPVGVMAVDRGGVVFIYNRKMAELEGLEPELVLGKHITEVFNHNHPAREMLTVLECGQPVMDAYRRYFNDQGREINLIASAYPLKRQDQVVASVVVARMESFLSYLLKKELPWLDQSPENSSTSPNGTSYTLSHFLGTSQSADLVRKQVVKAAPSSCPVLISGEPGTGKEIIAQAIHNLSRFRDEPYMAINCAALPTGLLEELLFGSPSHAEGKSHAGLIKQARRGTLFLDQVDKMGLPVQSRLLRALQEKHFNVNRPVDSPDDKLDCRIISATSCPPDTCIEHGRLRKDLYLQLAGGEVITIPPLRQR
ncbi:MAG TPA: sigma 54-interacting transcriptional regulator, partial [Firmicutes bacterium]|nr:sigma 54-interacting transcriptional regulator [Bacillota bacterium]